MASRFFGALHAARAHLVARVGGFSGEILKLRNDIETAFLRQQNESSGTTAQRPTSPFTGQQFYDTSLSKTVVWNGSAWNATSSPIVTQATWFIDPANVTGLVSDANTGIDATHPVRTWNGGVIAKFGTISPRLRQNTTFTFLSSHTDNSDPIEFTPYVENGARCTIQGTTPTVVATGNVLASTTAKNRATPQLLQANLGAGAAIGQLIVNTTTNKSSRAWVYKSIGAGVFSVTQPMKPQSIPLPFASIADMPEVDTWANGDTVNLLSVVAVNLVRFEPLIVDYDLAFDNQAYVYQLAIFDPFGAASDRCFVNSEVSIVECSLQRIMCLTGILGDDNIPFIFNCDNAGGMEGGAANVGSQVIGGCIRAEVFVASVSGARFDADVIIDSPLSVGGTTILATVQVGSGATITGLTSSSVAIFPNYGYTADGILYGAGAINMQGVSRLVYATGAGKAASIFKLSGGVKLNGGTDAWLATAAAGPTGGKTVSAANLDTDLGATVGCYMNPGGASVSNAGDSGF